MKVMIPDEEQIKTLWDKYNLPERKRRHCTLVARVALFLATRLSSSTHQRINTSLLNAAALLHDIDKNAQKLPGEQHPDAAVRILQEEGMKEVADLVRTHPLHAILDPTTSLKSWEEKILYLADKMVKYEIMTVDERFALWRAENLPAEAVSLLNTAYPQVKALEREILSFADVGPRNIIKLAKVRKSSKIEEMEKEDDL